MASVLTPTPPVVTAAAGRRRRRPGPVIAVLAVVVTVVGLVTGLLLDQGPGGPGPLAGNLGLSQNRPLPASVLRIPLVNQQGQVTSLDAFRGQIVVLTSFLTSCQETCPLTTGAFLDMQRALAAAGMAGKVTFIEASVDPGRDVPARLAAYARVTGTHWPLLTGTAVHLAALWHYFGVWYQKVKEGTPPGIDWETGKPYRYDVNHTDGFIVLDQTMDERFATGAMPDLVGGKLQGRLRTLLDAQGRQNLDHPAPDSWTVPEGLQAIGWVAGRTIPASN